jgi:hypothetical protein
VLRGVAVGVPLGSTVPVDSGAVGERDTALSCVTLGLWEGEGESEAARETRGLGERDAVGEGLVDPLGLEEACCCEAEMEPLLRGLLLGLGEVEGEVERDREGISTEGKGEREKEGLPDAETLGLPPWETEKVNAGALERVVVLDRERVWWGEALTLGVDTLKCRL